MVTQLRRRGWPDESYRCQCGKRTEPPALFCYSCVTAMQEQREKERQLKSKRLCDLYAISVKDDSTAVIKFGIAGGVADRLKTLQTGSPVILVVMAVCKARPHHEKMLHRRIIRHVSHGEWFVRNEVTLEIVEMIRAGALVEFLDSQARKIKPLQGAGFGINNIRHGRAVRPRRLEPPILVK